MYLRTLEIYDLDPLKFRISIASSIKNTKGKLDLLNDIDMLLMVEKSFTG